eukprot:scaffold1.g5330.t1
MGTFDAAEEAALSWDAASVWRRLHFPGARKSPFNFPRLRLEEDQQLVAAVQRTPATKEGVRGFHRQLEAGGPARQAGPAAAAGRATQSQQPPLLEAFQRPDASQRHAVTLVALQQMLAVAVLCVLRRLLPARAPAPASQPTDIDVSTRTPAKKQQPTQQQPGTSIKQLMKSAQKSRPGAQGPDCHAHSKLFIAGLRGHGDSVTGLAWSADGTALATACEDRTVRLFDLRDLSAKNVPFKRKELLRVGAIDVAFVSEDNSRVAVQTSGLANYAGLALLDFSPREPEVVWERENVHRPPASGRCLAGSTSSKGGVGVLVAASTKTDLRIFDAAGRELGGVDTGGLNNYMASISRDGRYVAASTFTADVRVHEVVFDRTGSFSGITRNALALKGHRRRARVLSLDFSPDLTKMVLTSAFMALPNGQAYARLAWGPDGFIAGCHGSMVHILDARTGEVVDRIEAAHDGEVLCLQWSPVKLAGPQGMKGVLATGGADGRVRLWWAPTVLV